MIREIGEDLLEEVVEFSWEIFSDSRNSGFPKYRTCEEMRKYFLRSVEREDDKLLACYEGEELIGVLNLFVDEENEYLQARGGVLAKRSFDIVCDEFIRYLESNYSGYKMYFGYPVENVKAIKYLKDIKAKPVDASTTMNLKKVDFVRVDVFDEVVLLTDKYYKEYGVFHDKHNPNMYWNSERIFEKIDIWKIYVIMKEGKIVGSIFIKFIGDTESEVFGISVDEEYKYDNFELMLLSEGVYNIFQDGREQMLYFVDEDDEVSLEASLKVGFKQIDTYRSYKVSL